MVDMSRDRVRSRRRANRRPAGGLGAGAASADNSSVPSVRSKRRDRFIPRLALSCAVALILLLSLSGCTSLSVAIASNLYDGYRVVQRSRAQPTSPSVPVSETALSETPGAQPTTAFTPSTTVTAVPPSPTLNSPSPAPPTPSPTSSPTLEASPTPSPVLSPTPTPTATSSPIPIPTSIRPTPEVFGGVSPSPPEADYVNRVYRNQGRFIFEYRDDEELLRYLYEPETGTLHDLRVSLNQGQAFWPSYFGGPVPVFRGEERFFWRGDLQAAYRRVRLDGNELRITWIVADDLDRVSYTYRFAISGKTLRIQVSSPSRSISRFELDRSEGTTHPRVVTIPYLTTHNILLSDDVFVSMFFDWTTSNASAFRGPLNWVASSTSAYYAQHARYLPRTDGSRLALQETVYLTVSKDLPEVFPNIPNPPSPYRDLLSRFVVLDLKNGTRYFASDARFLRSYSEVGLKKLFVVRHNWQRKGYDNAYPSVLPANPAFGGEPGLRRLSQTMADLGYLFGLHENYVDFYPNSSDWNEAQVALDTKGRWVRAWYNPATGIQSYLLSPVHAPAYADQYSREIHSRYGTSAAFLDVHTSVAPWFKVDYDAAEPGAARFAKTFQTYRQVLNRSRALHQGPILGEGGNHFLWAGYVDAVEAEFAASPGEKMPLVVDFALEKIHPLMVGSGAGYIERFFWQDRRPQETGFSDAQLNKYLATTIAYGHVGFIPDPFTHDIPFPQVKRIYRLMAPLQRLYVLSQPTSIRYFSQGEWLDVSQAVIQGDTEQVWIRYENGLEVYVNRHPKERLVIRPDVSPAWVEYSALVNGRRVDYVGDKGLKSYVLPPNGWLAFMPDVAPDTGAGSE